MDLESPSNFQIKGKKYSNRSINKEIGLWDFESLSNFKVKEKKNIQIGPETAKLEFCGPDSHLMKVQYRIWNLIKFPNQRKNFIEIAPETTKLCFN